MLKPWSAKIRSPGRSLSRILQFLVIYLSETRPPQTFDINEMLPGGVMTTSMYFGSIMLLVVTPSLCTCLQITWPINEKF